VAGSSSTLPPVAGSGPARRLVFGTVALIAVLAALTVLRWDPRPASSAPVAPGAGSPATSSGPRGTPVDVSTLLLLNPRPAPPIRLEDQDGQAFDLAALRGSPVFVFFGYTHCPDVCPATVGRVGQAMEAYGGPVRAVFVTIDPERDTPASLREYIRYLAEGFVTTTGTAEQIATTAAAWDVKYARVAAEAGEEGYGMSHTADVFVLDATGTLRAKLPFGTEADAMTAVLRVVAGTAPVSTPDAGSGPPASAAPASATPLPATGGLDVLVGSSSVWAGPAAPILLNLGIGGARIADPAAVATVQLETSDGLALGPSVETVAVQPPGEAVVWYVASPAIPSPGWWRLAVSLDRGGIRLTGAISVAALDPGATAAIGSAAPTAHSPTLADVSSAKAVTTDPAPDLRLSRLSTTDALAAHQPFVLVVDSWKFRVSQACGRALEMARFLEDRWPGVAFIHLEPLVYDVVTDTPVLRGSLGDPTLTDVASAWGLAGAPWGPLSMPWVFVVDGNGMVRSKSEGVMGTDDVDVIVSLIEAGH
jgi:protein SCO1/2